MALSQRDNTRARHSLPTGRKHLYSRAGSLPGYPVAAVTLAAAQPGRTRSRRLGVRGIVSAARLLITSYPFLIRWRGVILTVGEAKPGTKGRSSSHWGLRLPRFDGQG